MEHLYKFVIRVCDDAGRCSVFIKMISTLCGERLLFWIYHTPIPTIPTNLYKQHHI